MTTTPRRDPVRSLSNRIFLMISGRRLRAYSVVRHLGARTGREYTNPVSAYPLEDGFVIPVLYGPESRWVRNALATGRLTLRTMGRDHPLTNPELVTASRALAAVPCWQRTMLTARAVDTFLLAHAAR